jgi:hypothetical protein
MLAVGFGFVANSVAHPLETRDDFQIVHLTFHGGPASYDLAIPADNNVYSTSTAL